MERYVYIDETGDLGEKGSKYFIITAVWTENVAFFDRLIKNMRRNKFKKELKNVSEIKANNSKSTVIKYLLEKVSQMEDVHAQSIILEKEKVYSKYLKKNKDKTYNFVCGHLSNIAIDAKHLVIRIDKSKGKQDLIRDFNAYFEMKLKEIKWNCSLEIYHSWSHAWSGLQVADIISWAVFQKFENNNDEYFKIIERKTNINHMWK